MHETDSIANVPGLGSAGSRQVNFGHSGREAEMNGLPESGV